MTRARTTLLSLVLLAGPAWAQETTVPSRPYDPKPDSYRSPPGHRPTSGTEEGGAAVSSRRWRGLEVALSDESIWAGLQSPIFGWGHISGGFYADDDDDHAAMLKLMGFTWPGATDRLRLGLGLGGYYTWLEEPGEDREVAAVTLSGAASYAIPIRLPTYVVLDASWAPDFSTFDEGNQLLDLVARVEADVCSFATLFAGYRFLGVELEDDLPEERHTLDNRFHGGIRFVF